MPFGCDGRASKFPHQEMFNLTQESIYFLGVCDAQWLNVRSTILMHALAD
jgi:hypothetical protein